MLVLLVETEREHIRKNRRNFVIVPFFPAFYLMPARLITT